MPAYFVPLVVTVLVPLAFALWMASRVLKTRLDGLLLLIATAFYTAFALLAGPIWGWIGMGWRWAISGIVLVAGGAMLRRWPGLPWRPKGSIRAWANVLTKVFLILVFGVQLIITSLVFRAPVEPVGIAAPLAEGRYLVVSGGRSPNMNGHYGVPAQRHAFDIVALDGDGRRADGLFPADVNDYDIYARSVIAPCDGEILDLHDGAADTKIGGRDDQNPAGNFVSLLCAIDGVDITLLLAHFRPGSIAVAKGDQISTGSILGEVGSSGNSSEPHLHIHAVEGHETDRGALLFTGSPVPLLITGRNLKRNDVIQW